MGSRAQTWQCQAAKKSRRAGSPTSLQTLRWESTARNGRPGLINREIIQETVSDTTTLCNSINMSVLTFESLAEMFCLLKMIPAGSCFKQFHPQDKSINRTFFCFKTKDQSNFGLLGRTMVTSATCRACTRGALSASWFPQKCWRPSQRPPIPLPSAVCYWTPPAPTTPLSLLIPIARSNCLTFASLTAKLLNVLWNAWKM